MSQSQFESDGSSLMLVVLVLQSSQTSHLSGCRVRVTAICVRMPCPAPRVSVCIQVVELVSDVHPGPSHLVELGNHHRLVQTIVAVKVLG